MSGDAALGGLLGRGGGSVGTAGTLALRIGTAVVLASGSLAVLGAVALLATAPTFDPAIVLRAATTPPAAAMSLHGLVYAGALGLFVGGWYVGVGLIVTGLYD